MPCVLLSFRWIMSSKRRQTWTTWHSCTRDGQHGCEWDPCWSLWSSEGRNTPKSTGSGAMEPQSTMQERGGGCRDPPSGPHRIPVAQLHPAIQLTQRNGSVSVSPRCVGSSSRWGGGVGGGKAQAAWTTPPTNPCINNNKINVCQLSKHIGFTTGKICRRQFIHLEQKSAVISEFLGYICAKVEGKGDPVWGILCLWTALGRARLAAELSPAGAGVEGCVTRRFKGLRWKPEGLWQTFRVHS